MGSIQRPDRSLRIGVDVGGTNTDAVILDPSESNSAGRGILALQKTPTTSPNVTDGIETAVRSVLEQSAIDRSRIACLTIGTTHFVNAIVENDSRRLSKVAIIRLSKSFTKEIPPFSDFPPTLKHIMNGYYCFVSGGMRTKKSNKLYRLILRRAPHRWIRRSFNCRRRNHPAMSEDQKPRYRCHRHLGCLLSNR